MIEDKKIKEKQTIWKSKVKQLRTLTSLIDFRRYDLTSYPLKTRKTVRLKKVSL